MRWLITTDGPHAHHYHRMAVGKALRYAGHEVLLLDIRHQSPYDAFDKFDPEIVWTQAYNLNEPMIKCIQASSCKVFMRAFDYGTMKKDIERLNEGGHNIMVDFAGPEEIANVSKIAHRISFVCNHYIPSMFDDAMGHWKKIVRVVPNMLGFCPFIYAGGQTMKEFASDASFIGSYHHRKPALNDYIVGLNKIKVDQRKLNVKIFSSWPWPSEYYCGIIPAELNKHVYHNATVCPNISEDHSRLIGHDVIERIFSILGGGNFCLSDYVSGACELFPDEMVFTDSARDFHQRLQHYVKYPHETKIFAEKGKEKVWGEHTYFHRAAELFRNLDLPNEAKHMLSIIPKARRELDVQPITK
jgi:hypothetical protein